MSNNSLNDNHRLPNITQEAPPGPYLWHLNPSIFVLVELLHELLHLFSECGVWGVLEKICSQHKWDLSCQYVCLCLISSPWTHHPCSSPGHLQLPEEVLQLLPLDVAITWKTDRPWRHVIAAYHRGLSSVLLTRKNPISADVVTVSNRSQHGSVLPRYWFKHEPFTSNSLPSPLAQ